MDKITQGFHTMTYSISVMRAQMLAPLELGDNPDTYTYTDTQE